MTFPLDPGEFVAVREVSPGELLTLATTVQMTDPGGVLLALPHLATDPQVSARHDHEGFGSL